MNKARRHEMVRRLADVQQLRVARAQLHLMDRQEKTNAAAKRAEQSRSEHAQAQGTLDQLMAQQPLCPTRYRIACEHLLVTDADLQEQDGLLETAKEEEQQQRLQWHRQRQQANWLKQEEHGLAKKLARKAEEKRIIASMGLIWHTQEQEP